MNRISVRGIGIAAAGAAAVTTLVSSTVADAATPRTRTAEGVPLAQVAGFRSLNAMGAALASYDQSLADQTAAEESARVAAEQAALDAARAAVEQAAAEQARQDAEAAAAAAAAAQRAAAAARAARGSARPVEPGSARAIGLDLAAAKGWTGEQFACLDTLWSRESGWRTNAANSSGAYGIPQALPGSKMASAGPDWQTNAATQIRWGLGYIQGRYGSPCSALRFWQGHRWY